MTFIFEVIGVVVLAAAARALLPANPIAITTAIATIAVGIGGASFWLDGYSSARALLEEHASDQPLTLG